jgi:cupin fold WbuC family metalloprotein
MIEKIIQSDKILSIIIRSEFKREGIEFFTPTDFSQQLGYMNRPKGYIIEPHKHIASDRTIQLTQEVLVLKRGKVKIDFFDDEGDFIESIILYTGDVVLLASGGHGLEMLEDSELIEIKQGPYQQENDKVMLSPTTVYKYS